MGALPNDHAMQLSSRRRVAAFSFALLASVAAATERPPLAQEPPMTTQSANGPFDVQIAPQALSPVAAASGLGRLSIDKHFHGTLDATSTGEMLAFRSTTDGSAGYVAMETVRGTLAGRRGSFVLQHSSTMTRGATTQSITVVPDSGTDALRGLAGRMTVDIGADGAHAYRFEFTLPDKTP
jgi:hypothetical protein